MVKKVQLGKTELFVNPIGLGANAVGGHNIYPNLNEDDGRDLIRSAMANGVNFIDTAFSYGPKRSEELIGEVLKADNNRSEAIIATKASHVLTDERRKHSNRPNFIKQAVDDALIRLQTDYIDLFYLHYPDEDTPKAEAIGALKELKDVGKIRHIGVSNFSIAQLKEANTDGHVDVLQAEYNLLDRSAEEQYFAYLREANISLVPYFPLASGLLTGKFAIDATFDDLRQRLPYFQAEVFAKNIAKVDQLKVLAKEKQCDVAQLVLAWYLTRDVIDAIIPGAKRPEQLEKNLASLEVQLNAEEITHIDHLFQEEKE